MSRPFIACLVVLSAHVALAGDWNQWRGPARDGLAIESDALRESLPDEGLRPLWVSEEIQSAREGGWGSPVVANGRVFLYSHSRHQLSNPGQRKYPWLAPDKRTGMTDEEYNAYEIKRRDEDERRANAYKFRETLFCLNEQTGETLWKDERESIYSRFPQSGTPTVVNGRVLVLGAGRMARCFDERDGYLHWETRLPGEFRDEFMQASFAVSGDVAAIMAKHLFGLDLQSGEILWQGERTGSHSSPVVLDNNGKTEFVVNVSGAKTTGVDAQTGKELWQLQTEGGLSTPIVAGRYIITYGNSRKKGLRCFERTDEGVQEVWVYHGVADKGSSPVVVGDYIYVQGERRMACVELATGKAAWMTTIDLEKPQYTSLIAGDGKVIYAHRGVLSFRATPEAFQPLIQSRIDGEGLMATEEQFRTLLKLDEIEQEPNGQQRALKLYQQKVGKHGPLDCCTPAIANGRLFLRLKNAVASYDWTAP